MLMDAGRDLPEYVRMFELVHELHFSQHVGPVGALLVHLEHHYLAGGLVRHLQQINDCQFHHE